MSSACFVIRVMVISTKHQQFRSIPKYAVYHTKCLVNFYNRARRKYSTENVEHQSASQLNAIAFAEVVSYIEGLRECQETVPVFLLAELGKMYCNIIEDLGGDQTARLHTTRLKEKLEAEIPDLVPYKQGRDIVSF